MKPSTKKLFTMLPRVFKVSVDLVNEKIVGIDVVNREGNACGIDGEYPGFQECLKRLVTSGHVMHVASEIAGTPTKARITQHFVSLAPGAS